MKAIVFKILSVLIACGGAVSSIIEKNPLFFFGFMLVGVISYELAVLIEKNNK